MFDEKPIVLFFRSAMQIVMGTIFAIYLAKKFAKAPTINIVQGRLENGEGDDIKEAMKYLKIVNNE